MSLLELFTVTAAAALVSARWLPPSPRRAVALTAATGAVLSGAALAVAGPRWQMLPVLAAAALALPFALAPELRRRAGHRARRAPWWLALPGSALCLALIATGPAAAWALPVPAFPEPSGRHPVGTTVVQWTDPARPETATDDPKDRRTVVAQLWYPASLRASAGDERAQYLGRDPAEARTVADALADYAGLPSFTLDALPEARSHATPDAPVAERGGRFPVVLFSPGLGGVRTQNTAWAEELASHGYVVAALDHPYDSAAVVLADGRTIRTKVAATGDPDTDEQRAAEWTATRAADLRSALAHLTRLDRGDIPGPLAGRLDTARAAATGHSLGGAAALLAARQDTRFTAAIDIDGYPHDPDPGPYPQPVLALTQTIGPDTDPDYVPRLTKTLNNSASTSYRLTVPGTAHLTFTDAPLYMAPLPALTGSLDRSEGPRTTAAATLAFLDATLRSHPTPLETALSAHGDLTVHRPRRP
nr:hypothetical protein [Streptomyces sp. TRM49041]